MSTTAIWFIGYYLLSPFLAAWYVRRRAEGAVGGAWDEVDAARYTELRRGFLFPWLLCLVNVAPLLFFVAGPLLDALGAWIGPFGAGALIFAVAMLPVAVVGFWMADLDRAVRQTSWTRAESLLFELKGLSLRVFSFCSYLFAAWLGLEVFDSWLLGAVFLVVALLLNVMLFPRALAWVLGARRAEQDLRERVQAQALRGGVRVDDVLVAPTRRSKIANALVVGVLPRTRLVILTDFLVDALDDAELEGVVAHEIAHLEKHHLAWMFVAATGVYALVWAAGYPLLAYLWSPTVSDGVRLSGFGALGAVSAAAVLLLVFKTLSRRFEYQADAIAARNVADPEVLVSALYKMMQLNYMETAPAGSDFLASHPHFARRAANIRAAHGSRDGSAPP